MKINLGLLLPVVLTAPILPDNTPLPTTSVVMAADGATSSLSGITMPRGGAAFDKVDANFSHLLTGLAKEKYVSLLPLGDEPEVFLWKGSAYRADRVGFTRTALTAALTNVGYEVKEIDDNELRETNIFASFDSNDESLPFKPTVLKRPQFFQATHVARGKSLIGAWIESDDALALGLLPVEFKAPKVKAALPPAPSGAFLVKDNDNTLKGLPASKLPIYPKLAPKPGTVRGMAKDSSGKPIPNVEVAVYSSIGGGVRTTHKARTNAQGLYQVLVPAGICEVAQADCTVRYNGVGYKLMLEPVRGKFAQFESRKGHVENLILRTGGKSGGTIRLLDNLESGTIEIIVAPIGKLMDASAGRTFVYRYDTSNYKSEMYLNGLPLGRYKLTARLLDDGEALPLRVAHTFGDDAAPKTSLQVDFKPGYSFSQVNTNKSNRDVQAFEVTLSP